MIETAMVTKINRKGRDCIEIAVGKEITYGFAEFAQRDSAYRKLVNLQRPGQESSFSSAEENDIFEQG